MISETEFTLEHIERDAQAQAFRLLAPAGVIEPAPVPREWPESACADYLDRPTRTAHLNALSPAQRSALARKACATNASVEARKHSRFGNF